MALVKCHECGKEMSDTLSTCPHCGIEIIKNTYIPKKDNEGLNLAIDIILLIVLLLISLSSVYNCIKFFDEINLYNLLNIINNIIYILFFWSIFLYYKLSKSAYKLLATINLFVFIVLFITISFTANSDFGITFALPQISIITDYIESFIPLIFLYLIVLNINIDKED